MAKKNSDHSGKGAETQAAGQEAADLRCDYCSRQTTAAETAWEQDMLLCAHCRAEITGCGCCD